MRTISQTRSTSLTSKLALGTRLAVPALILLLGACSEPEGEAGAGSDAATGESAVPQTTQRFPQFENDDVTVWRTVIAPHQPLSMHRHDHGRVIVALKGGTLKIIPEQGEPHTVTWETGSAYWLPADPPGELHGDVNEGEEAIEVMVIEMRR